MLQYSNKVLPVGIDALKCIECKMQYYQVVGVVHGYIIVQGKLRPFLTFTM